MTAPDWTAIVDAASRAHVEATQGEGAWDGLDALTRYGVRQALLAAVRAAVDVALAERRQLLAAVGGAADLARTQALADALEVVETYGDRAAIGALRDYISAEEGSPS